MTEFQKFIAGFGYAIQGIRYAVRTQRNIRVHLGITAVVVIGAAILSFPLWKWIVLVLTISMVLAAELINTAIEATIDLITPEFHPMAKIAKDVAAGAVLVCAIGAAAVGVLLVK